MQYWKCDKCQKHLVTKSYRSTNSKTNNFTLIYVCGICNKKNFINTKNATEIHGAKVVDFFNTDNYSEENINKELKRHNLS